MNLGKATARMLTGNFVVGDKVRGLPSANLVYGITKEGWEGTVKAVRGKGEIIVANSHADFLVESPFFELVE